MLWSFQKRKTLLLLYWKTCRFITQHISKFQINLFIVIYFLFSTVRKRSSLFSSIRCWNGWEYCRQKEGTMACKCSKNVFTHICASLYSHLFSRVGWSKSAYNNNSCCKRGNFPSWFSFAYKPVDPLKLLKTAETCPHYLYLFQDVVGVTIGGTLGHCLCTGLAVLGGRMIAQRISVRTGMFTALNASFYLMFSQKFNQIIHFCCSYYNWRRCIPCVCIFCSVFWSECRMIILM